MTTAPTTRLVAAPLVERAALGDEARPVLDPQQREVVDRVVAGADRALLVTGAPGTGRTTLALEATAAAVAAGLAPDDVLVLAASRRAAADLRDRLAVRLGRTAGRPLVQTPAAVAFAVLRASAGALGEPTPVLVSGPEQDLALAELLAGHASGDVRGPAWPPGVPEVALGTRAFRDELRDLLMRAAERGLAPTDLAALGRREDRPAWVAAAHLYEEYLDVMALAAATPDAGERLDPAVVVDAAVAALRGWDEDVPGVPCPRRRLVVVDDHQESTAATARLLRAFADRGARLLLLGDPDVAVQTFRGAQPALVARAAAAGAGELAAEHVVLRTVWRQSGPLREVTARITQRVAASGTVAHRRAQVPADRAAGPAPRVAVLPSAAQEAAWVAHRLRRAHLQGGVPWDEMAVLARAGSRVTAVRRALAQAGVPVRVVGSDVPLRDEPAVRPLLDAVRAALLPDGLDAEAAARLACSPLGGLDAVGLRRVRRALRAEELAGGGGRSSDVLLVEALAAPDRTATLEPHVGRPVQRLAHVLQAGRDAAAAPGADVQAVLWAVWDRAGLAEPWRRAALAGGSGGERADRDLDAVLALFRAAETFVERMPQATPLAFVDWVLAQDLPADSLAPASRAAGVSVLTPAGAAGGSWEVVAVVGVQEGVWPDLRLRDSMLGAQSLVDLLAGRESAAGPGEERARAARADVLADELRAFALACSRARTHLLVTAVDDQDATPSPFVDLVQPGSDDDGPDPRRTSAPAPLDLRGLVARLRATLELSAAQGRPDQAAARTLARLAAHGVPGADPSAWFGLAEPSSDAPLWQPDAKVPVSPSRLETAQRCALRWALEAAGGTPASSAQQSLGTLVHAIAQEHPTADLPTLRAELDRRWHELALGEGWPSVAARRRADAMLERLAAYLRAAGEPVLVEAAFTLETDRAVVRGSVDRVERAVVQQDGGGEVVEVVDLKTGSRVPTLAQAGEHAQLGAYQLAVDSGAVPGLEPGTRSVGARLVHLAQGSGAPTQRRQDGLGPEHDGPSWARALVDDVADRMAASSFEARANDLCDRCPVRRSCPLRGEGGQVVA